MTLTIDSESVDLPSKPDEAFSEYYERIADHLLQKNRCIGVCSINGQEVATIEAGALLFPAATEISVTSVSIRVALQANIALQCNTMRRIEESCETLVTDSLLADPKQVAVSWQELCEEIKSILTFIPRLGVLLTDAQVDSLVEGRLSELNGVMSEIAAFLSKGDVVGFSDTLEMKLLPWIVGLREFFQAQLTVVEAFGREETA
ncbi:hypothetical protein SAMN05444156_0218 [Verrucomicrobium sp. GAS474]|uniref:hypothetical protein n=1 Tax=Verrucomicrobium sp. GAS474 TaxID=1882831 RepID=UPI000879CA49|nr:hypothetical protein [Verrucomicrobium sp. GAS474]SDT86692.1 hypothetical protein SAMN05444156_0218 [Verrucomicrobium sp. GAS474]